MATIYRFIVENKTTESSGRKGGTGGTKGAGKKGKTTTLLGSMKGGVESNRKMRAINPLLNKMTGGMWERGMRLGRAGLGLVKYSFDDNGKFNFRGFSGPAVAILVALAITTLLKWQNRERQKAKELNAQNFKMLENGTDMIHGAYEITTNAWNGRHTYNQNK